MELELLKLKQNKNGSNIYCVDCFRKEFMNETKEKLKLHPTYPRYQRWLIMMLEKVSDLGYDKVLLLQGFEKLDGEKNLYSMRYNRSKLNLRIIYTIKNNSVILLCVFKEKGSNDYDKSIKRAKKRLSLL